MNHQHIILFSLTLVSLITATVILLLKGNKRNVSWFFIILTVKTLLVEIVYIIYCVVSQNYDIDWIAFSNMIIKNYEQLSTHKSLSAIKFLLLTFLFIPTLYTSYKHSSLRFSGNNDTLEKYDSIFTSVAKRYVNVYIFFIIFYVALIYICLILSTGLFIKWVLYEGWILIYSELSSIENASLFFLAILTVAQILILLDMLIHFLISIYSCTSHPVKFVTLFSFGVVPGLHRIYKMKGGPFYNIMRIYYKYAEEEWKISYQSLFINSKLDSETPIYKTINKTIIKFFIIYIPSSLSLRFCSGLHFMVNTLIWMNYIIVSLLTFDILAIYEYQNRIDAALEGPDKNQQWFKVVQYPPLNFIEYQENSGVLFRRDFLSYTFFYIPVLLIVIVEYLYPALFPPVIYEIIPPHLIIKELHNSINQIDLNLIYFLKDEFPNNPIINKRCSSMLDLHYSNRTIDILENIRSNKKIYIKC